MMPARGCAVGSLVHGMRKKLPRWLPACRVASSGCLHQWTIPLIHTSSFTNCHNFATIFPYLRGIVAAACIWKPLC